MSERPRVMHVLLSLDVGGLERNVVNQVREGRRLGQDVSILCVETRGTLAERAESLGARVYCCEKKPGLRFNTALRIRKISRAERPDVVHTHQIGPLFYTGLASLGLRIPLIVHTEHGKENYAANRKTRILGRMAARFAKVFYCLTQDMAQNALHARIVSPTKVRLINNGIDTSFYKEQRNTEAVRQRFGIPSDAPIIGTIGRLSEIKQQHLLIDAFAKVFKSFPKAHLLLVGEGPELKALQNRASDLQVADNVHFAGYQADTTTFLHAMDLFALTSRSEGMPQALLEACVAGKPVIATRVGGIPEVIEDGASGFLVEPGDVASLANGLCYLLSNPVQARAMAKTASQRVSNTFDITRMAAQYHSDFCALLPSTPVAANNGCSGDLVHQS